MEFEELKKQLCQTVLGAEDKIELLLVALLAQGHVLIEGEPGLGKSSLANALAKAVQGDFARVQFTPDLMPSDILGYSMFNTAQQSFDFIPGPIFNNIVLADEINRTSPRMQSALLESMNEKQVSIDGISHKLPDLFMVIATQNSLHSIGTYPLPEAQLDRFILSVAMEMPDFETQKSILQNHLLTEDKIAVDIELSADVLRDAQKECLHVPVSSNIQEYILELCEAVRNSSEFRSHLSIRAAVALMRCSQAMAYLNGHEAVYPEDVQKVFVSCLAHRFLNSSSGSLVDIQLLLKKLLAEQKLP